ncbi:MAG: cobalamin biosynthesis bifunctional protein CbiET [Rhodospirillales bacterium 24-66-33]|jgi:precorrin-6Y C5,15-methyltransferase (decarboxylating)|nr:precorrin-6y C5,15-methyltransferase (decarboxylating) subunit CbiE [Reyranella sp.]OYY33884.1 MAG: cobalamin biosynthesis bifunctional protein CbiET [Rhodospirillales bacterium 35-66-84]OYZ90890.1 MAG: cobalamin biosynthesis bifunctional protein CbiET [Rhodospirillales bacterium 24-66-33]OZB21200.1 MAG: cobalamin biosynthesis bifunctional protein CbiET [Rhodospirillales bacterium 39-66-50]HQS19263.1 precorrin-6y C5,15-methyltransferase (decarboxylating) subunit CbiE [Reyranella sp.]HQT1553
MKGRDESCTATRWLSIVGIGEDGVAGLSSVAKRLVSSADLVVGGKRQLGLADGLIRGRRLPWPSPIHDVLPEIEKHRGRPVAVLASGDPFHYGVGAMLLGRVPAKEMLCLPQPSSFSLAAARLGWSLQDVSLVSLHGRAFETIVRYLQPGARILALAWNGETPRQLARLLAERAMGQSKIVVMESMAGPRERVRSATAEGFDLADVAVLNIIAVEIVASAAAVVLPLAPGLNDALFESDGQLTKRDVRAVTLSALAPRQGELLWDVGLGAGSIAIEWLLCHASLKAIGFEERPERAARAAHNAATLGTPNLEIVQGRAPDAFEGQPQPDVIFIGGGLCDPGVLDAAWAALKPGGRFVSNAVTIESESRLTQCFQHHGGELLRLQVAKAARVGSAFAWRAAMPITQWRARKP